MLAIQVTTSVFGSAFVSKTSGFPAPRGRFSLMAIDVDVRTLLASSAEDIQFDRLPNTIKSKRRYVGLRP